MAVARSPAAAVCICAVVVVTPIGDQILQHLHH
jgi:hypothetical protein